MITSRNWTIFDETLLYTTQTIQRELGQTHGILFAAVFLDEFEDQLMDLASELCVRGQDGTTPRN